MHVNAPSYSVPLSVKRWAMFAGVNLYLNDCSSLTSLLCERCPRDV